MGKCSAHLYFMPSCCYWFHLEFLSLTLPSARKPSFMIEFFISASSILLWIFLPASGWKFIYLLVGVADSFVRDIFKITFNYHTSSMIYFVDYTGDELCAHTYNDLGKWRAHGGYCNSVGSSGFTIPSDMPALHSIGYILGECREVGDNIFHFYFERIVIKVNDGQQWQWQESNCRRAIWMQSSNALSAHYAW